MQFRSTDHLIVTRSELFRDLNANALTSIVLQSQKKHAQPKEQLILQSQTNKNVYFILFGCVKITSIAADGRERISDVLGVGDIFGEMTTLHDGPSYASVIALVASVFMVIDQANFMKLIFSQPEMSLKLLRIFAKRIEHKDRLINDLFFTDVNFRLAKHLLSMVRISSRKKLELDGDITVLETHGDRRCQTCTTISISQQDLASMVGVSRESVNKHLKTWERDGIIALSTGLIDICDVDRLMEMTEKNTEKV